MNSTEIERQIARFRLLDRLFWLAWLGLAVTIWLGYLAANDPATMLSQVAPDQAQCASMLPHPATMSAMGQMLYWGLFTLQVSIYVILLSALHLIVHRFARGRIFVLNTLAMMRWLGVVLILWPFLDTGATELVAASLKSLGDLKAHVPSYAIDVAPLSVGLFLVAMHYVLDRAIAIKSENDLTI